MTASFLPRGTQFQRSADSGATYTTVAEAKKIDFAIKGNSLDASNMDSPSAFKEFTPGMIDGGSAKVELNFINTDAVQNDLLGDLSAQTKLTWRVQLPNTRGRYDFTGYVDDFNPSFDVEKLAANSVAIKITGAVTWTPNV